MKYDLSRIFASNAPDQDKPAAFGLYEGGWGAESRPNNGKPTIKQFNYLQQKTDETFWDFYIRGSSLPYQDGVPYLDEAVVMKDGELQKFDKVKDEWKPTGGAKTAEDLIAEDGKTQAYWNSIFKTQSNFYVTPESFGGKADDPNFDNKVALQKALLSPLPLHLGGVYYSTGAHYCYSSKTITGNSSGTSGIKKIGNATTGQPPVYFGDNTSGVAQYDKFDVDCVLAIIPKGLPSQPNEKYATRINFSQFFLDRVQDTPLVDLPLTNYGLYAPRVAQSAFYDFMALSSGVGFKMPNPWMVTWIRCEASGRIPFALGSTEGVYVDPNTSFSHGGTSNTLISCWARSSKDHAYICGWMQYSSMISCGADWSGSVDRPVTAAYLFISSEMSLTSCALETLWGRALLARNGSYITMRNFNATSHIYGDDSNEAMFLATSASTIVWDGGRLTATSQGRKNRWFSSRNKSNFTASNVSNLDNISGFTSDINNTDKSLILVANDSAQFKYVDGTKTLESNLNPTKDNSVISNGFSCSGVISTTSEDGSIGVLNPNAGIWNKGNFKLGTGSIWRNTGALFWKGTSPTSGSDGFILSSCLGAYKTNDSKPTPAQGRIVGTHYFDTEKNKPFWWNGTDWFDAMGNPR